jgi:hypothetical protein
MKNAEMRDKILAILYKKYFEDPQYKFDLTELLHKLDLSIPQSIENALKGNTDTKRLWVNLQVLLRKEFISGYIRSQGADDIFINTKGIEHHEHQSKPGIIKVWEALTSPELIAHFMYAVIGIVIGVILGFLFEVGKR